jgi:hypothetical protein
MIHTIRVTPTVETEIVSETTNYSQHLILLSVRDNLIAICRLAKLQNIKFGVQFRGVPSNSSQWAPQHTNTNTRWATCKITFNDTAQAARALTTAR